jgi:hypothetical protein
LGVVVCAFELGGKGGGEPIAHLGHSRRRRLARCLAPRLARPSTTRTVGNDLSTAGSGSGASGGGRRTIGRSSLLLL